jgi:uncharacterized protein
MFKRKSLNLLQKWLQNDSRKPIVLRGARQVGKTELVRLFAREANLDLIELNFERIKISEFEKDNFQMERCLGEISALSGKRIDENSLIFFDEIQESKNAYSRLRFFKEIVPDLKVISAGSLLEVKLKAEPPKIPVGRIEYLFLGPLSFSEFLQALGEDILANIVESKSVHQLSESVHERLVELLQSYFFVGGMPEAVQAFASNKIDYKTPRDIHHQIMETYREDIYRYADGKSAEIIGQVLDHVSFEIGRKIVYSHYSQAKSTEVKNALNTLADIFLIQKVYHSNASGLPLRKNEDKDVFKTYFLDIGLYHSLMDVGWLELMHQNQDDLLTKGEAAEQFVAQHLYLGSGKTQRPRLHYWLRDKSSHKAEVDFLVKVDQSILPIEVKAGTSGSIKSLIRFMYEHQTKVKKALRYDLKYRENNIEECRFKVDDNSKMESVHFQLESLPLYFAF